jgi:hypothetical protein
MNEYSVKELLILGSTYIIYRKEYSEKAARVYGNGYTWVPVTKTKLRPPSDERGFHQWLLELIREKGLGDYRIVRTAALGERRGFHGVWMGSIDEYNLTTDRRYSMYKGIPSLPPSRDLYFKAVTQRTRFSKHRRHI